MPNKHCICCQRESECLQKLPQLQSVLNFVLRKVVYHIKFSITIIKNVRVRSISPIQILFTEGTAGPWVKVVLQTISKNSVAPAVQVQFESNHFFPRILAEIVCEHTFKANSFFTLAFAWIFCHFCWFQFAIFSFISKVIISDVRMPKDWLVLELNQRSISTFGRPRAE